MSLEDTIKKRIEKFLAAITADSKRRDVGNNSRYDLVSKSKKESKTFV